MTALAGIWSFDGRRPAAPSCARMLKAQAIYGSDGEGQWNDGPISLGRRLGKTLPEDIHDRQPVIGGGGKLALVADLRLDNRGDLIPALGIAAREAATLADSMILMRAFERWGLAVVDRLVGDFAFALWDGNRNCLSLGRDFLGQRPLHFHRGSGFFAFATMPKGLHALPEVPYAADASRVAEFLTRIPEAGSASFFEGIETVEPGHVLTVSGTSIESRKYWRPDLSPLILKSGADYVEALRDQLDQAVAARLRRAGGSVAAHLSGGLDSSAVAATAARLLDPGGGRIAAYTSVPRAGYRGGGIVRGIVDEGPLAAATAALYPNMDHILIRGGARSPCDGLDRNFFLYERPYPNLCNAVWINAIHDAAKARGTSVLLTGQMGNMGLSWSGMTHLPELLAGGRLLRFASASALLMRNGTRLGRIASQSLGPFLPEAVWNLLSRSRGKARDLGSHSGINPNAAAQLGITARAAARGLDLTFRPRANGQAARLWALTRVDLGVFNKGTFAGWGIDSRDPTTDRRLVEFCLRVPEEQFLMGGRPRGLARAALEDRLPPEVVSEGRKGYQAADWHEGLAAAGASLAEEIERIGAVPAAAETLDTGLLHRLAEAVPEHDWTESAAIRRYRILFLPAVSAGHFIRKASRTNG